MLKIRYSAVAADWHGALDGVGGAFLSAVAADWDGAMGGVGEAFLSAVTADSHGALYGRSISCLLYTSRCV